MKKISILIILCVSTLMGCNKVETTIETTEEIVYSEIDGRYLKIDDTNFLIENENLYILSNEDLYFNLTNGDKIKIFYDTIEETYPSKINVYNCIMIENGTDKDISENVFIKLKELGYNISDFEKIDNDMKLYDKYNINDFQFLCEYLEYTDDNVISHKIKIEDSIIKEQLWELLCTQTKEDLEQQKILNSTYHIESSTIILLNKYGEESFTFGYGPYYENEFDDGFSYCFIVNKTLSAIIYDEKDGYFNKYEEIISNL